MKSEFVGIRKTQKKWIDKIFDKGTDFELNYEPELGSIGWKNMDSPTKSITKEQCKNGLEKEGKRLACDKKGNCIIDVYSGKFYAFKTDPNIIKDVVKEREEIRSKRLKYQLKDD